MLPASSRLLQLGRAISLPPRLPARIPEQSVNISLVFVTGRLKTAQNQQRGDDLGSHILGQNHESRHGMTQQAADVWLGVLVFVLEGGTEAGT